jgi:hypothetical protein
LQANVEHTFLRHLALLKAQYCHPWVVGDDGVMCLALLDGWKLDHHAFFFITMKSNCNSTMLPPFNVIQHLGCGRGWDPMAF